MKDNRLGGIALIVGAVSGMITMSLPPVAGAHPITPAQFEKLATLMIGVHVLAIASVRFHSRARSRWRDTSIRPAASPLQD